MEQTASRRTARRSPARSVPALVALGVGGLAFVVLLVLVLSRWEPLRTLDREVSLWLNQAVSGSGAAAAVLRVVTDLGDPLTTITVLSVLTAVLLVRRLPRTAAWVAVTGLGLAVLDPVVKGLVGRPRPVLPVVVATAPGESFPSGHALASFVTFTVLLLVALPSVPRRARPWAVGATAVVIAAVGFTRVALGVHYVSDVLAGWALGAVWVSVTALALRAWQVGHGEPPSALDEGLEPHAEQALRPAPGPDRPLGGRPRRTALELAAGLAAVLALVTGFGLLITDVLHGTWVGRLDRAAVRALSTLGVPDLDDVMGLINKLGGTRVVTVVALAAAILAVAALRRWRPAVFLAVSLAGEVAVYLLVSRVLVPRDRPEAGNPAESLPGMASYPSGHAAAAMTLYGAIALIVYVHVHARWRSLALAVPVLVGLLVAAGRLYRGVHYPTDVIGSALLSVTWLTITYRLVLRPPRPAPREDERLVLSGPGRPVRRCRRAGSAARVGSPRSR